MPSSLEQIKTVSNTVIQHDSDALPVHPQIQTMYQKNLKALSNAWNERFSTESTHTMPDGGRYGMVENSKNVVDYNAKFWIDRSNSLIEQQYMSMTAQGVSPEILKGLTTIINTQIRSDMSLTAFGKYIRIESIVLAYATHATMKK
jgi:hypothetical protein